MDSVSPLNIVGVYIMHMKLGLFAPSLFGVLFSSKERPHVSLGGSYQPIQSEREVSVKAVT
jgi:hypothetical protein